MSVKTIIGNYLSKEVLGPFAAIYGVGFAPLLILPFLFTAMIDHLSISEAEAGMLVSIKLGSMCLGSLLISPVIDRFSKRNLALLATVLAAAGNLLLVFTDNVNTSYSYFIIAGLGYGLALAAGNSTVAALGERSDKTFNKVIFLGTILMVILLNTFPRIIVQWSFPGALVGLVILHCLMLPALLLIPSSAAVKTTNIESKPQYKMLCEPLSLAIILMMFFYFVRDTMVWVFAENIATSRLGIDIENVGLLFSVHGATSLLGPLLLLWLMYKYGKAKLLLAGILVTGFISICISQTQSVLIFSLMVIVWSTAHFFTYSCIMGYAAQADPKGRIAAAAGAAVMGGTAVAPALAGYAMDSGGLNQFTLYVVLAVLATLTFSCLTTILFCRNKNIISNPV